MATRRRLLRWTGAVGFGGLAGCLHGSDGDGGGDGDGTFTDDFTVTSAAFAEGESIPERYTADGEDVSPPLSFEGVPEEAETLALICDDPDAPGGTFVHWLLWNVPADTGGLEEDVPPDEEVSGLDGARPGVARWYRYEHDSNGLGSDGVSDDGLHRDVFRDGEKYCTERVSPPTPANEAFNYPKADLQENVEQFIKRFQKWHGVKEWTNR